jgi:AcrR family transcriptional regulator
MERAAEAAGISRATAYRYFPNQRSLLVATHPEIEVTSLLGTDPPEDPAERLDVVLGEFLRLTLDSEPELRAMLRLSLEPRPADPDAVPLRRGRAIACCRDAMARAV